MKTKTTNENLVNNSNQTHNYQQIKLYNPISQEYSIVKENLKEVISVLWSIGFNVVMENDESIDVVFIGFNYDEFGHFIQLLFHFDKELFNNLNKWKSKIYEDYGDTDIVGFGERNGKLIFFISIDIPNEHLSYFTSRMLILKNISEYLKNSNY